MTLSPIRFATLVLAALGFAAMARGAATADDEARFLAGLPVPNSALEFPFGHQGMDGARHRL